MNGPTLLIVLFLVLWMALAVRQMWKNRGKCSCSGDCGSCAGNCVRKNEK